MSMKGTSLGSLRFTGFAGKVNILTQILNVFHHSNGDILLIKEEPLLKQ